MRFHRLDVLRRFPHPGRAFIQGLVLAGETVWESTGLYGESSLRRYQLGAEQPQKHVPLLPQLFGEGICCVGGSIWQLTWRERIALRWDAATMKLSEMVPFDRDGWGICSSGGYVLTSDGSSELVFRNPGTLQPLSSMPVHCNGYPVSAINDLAYVAGRIWANLSSELEIALAQIRHPRPVGITGIPIRTRLKRSRPGAIVDTTEISDSGGVSSQT